MVMSILLLGLVKNYSVSKSAGEVSSFLQSSSFLGLNLILPSPTKCISYPC